MAEDFQAELEIWKHENPSPAMMCSRAAKGFLTGPVHLPGPCQKLLMAGRRTGRLSQFCDSDILNIEDLKEAGLVHAEARRLFKECRMHVNSVEFS